MRIKQSILASVIVCAISSACSESPSFDLRWAIATKDSPEQAPPLTSVVQCSSVGISTVQVTTTGANSFVDVRNFSCFPPEFSDPESTVAGPELDPGTYLVSVIALGRNGSSWASSPAYEQELRIEGKEPVLLGDIVLLAPSPCEDGIDNDNDGLVDQSDPGCRVGPNEEDDIRITQFRFRPTLLDENPNATCIGVGLARIRIRIDEEPDSALEVVCDTNKTELFIRQLDPGEHTVSVVGLNNQGEEMTVPQQIPFTVTETQGDFVDLGVDFGADDFLNPIQAEMRFSLAYQISENFEDIRTCSPTAKQGLLEIDQVRIRILDGEGNPLDPPVQLTTGEILDGSPIACPNGVLVTEDLVWGRYQIAVDALSSANEVCFSNTAEPTFGAPSSAFTVFVERTSSESSCKDCETSADCSCLDCCSEQNVCLP